MKRFSLLAAAVALCLTACDQSDTPLDLDPSFVIEDAVHNEGNPHFFWLPPMVEAVNPGGVFDAIADPVVQICEFAGAGCLQPLLAEFTMTSGPGSETIRLESGEEHFIVNWHTNEFGLDPAKSYRISVIVGGHLLGFADVDVVNSGAELKRVDTGLYIPLKDGRTLPIKFRIEEGAVVELGVGFGLDQFSYISPGTFWMGSDNGDPDEHPVHLISMTNGFYLQKTEVTQGQWKAVMGSNPSFDPACGDLCPVERVSWYDVQDFLAALNTLYPGKNYRLATEAEWEYSARAGTSGDYGGTGIVDQMGWYLGNSGSQLHPVAQKAANHWGIYDMHGNVWEWIADWYSPTYYSVSPTEDPQGPSTGTERMTRGGSFTSPAFGLRSARRSGDPASGSWWGTGFRLARDM